ncbi:RlpA-like double-psi beta-barrel-protein domain-containing protein-containing protein [Infundibulicybe gibba]|nr:RlpA-like double-psi beta-barrel-protein domain-containing protein-containing protein [Infundibulicybe gibba]
MFNLASYAALALSTISAVSGFVVPRSDPPAGWATDYLESYSIYHTRYLALGCNNQHGKPFFDECCHPLLATESLETARPAQCIPSASASSSAARAEPTSTINPPVDGGDDDDDEDCEDDDEGDDSLTSSFSQAPAPQPTTSQAPAPQPTTTQVPKPTSETPAPKPTTTQAPQPTSEAPAPKPTTSQAAPPPDNKSPPPSGDLVTGGIATFFDQNGNAGACGADSRRYGDTGVKSPLCGKQVRITNTQNNKSVTVTIADACPTCENENSIDLSRGAFQQIATFDQGVANTPIVSVAWSFV